MVSPARRAVVIGLACATVLVVFPPYDFQHFGSPLRARGFVFAPPTGDGDRYGKTAQIDLGRLVMELAGIAMITATVGVACIDRRSDDDVDSPAHAR